jgi:hypothetical protein
MSNGAHSNASALLRTISSAELMELLRTMAGDDRVFETPDFRKLMTFLFWDISDVDPGVIMPPGRRRQ